MPAVRRLAWLPPGVLVPSALFRRRVVGWRIIDSACFSMVTVATVDCGDLARKAGIAKAFTIRHILRGSGLSVAGASAIASAMIHCAHRDNKDP